MTKYPNIIKYSELLKNINTEYHDIITDEYIENLPYCSSKYLSLLESCFYKINYKIEDHEILINLSNYLLLDKEFHKKIIEYYTFIFEGKLYYINDQESLNYILSKLLCYKECSYYSLDYILSRLLCYIDNDYSHYEIIPSLLNKLILMENLSAIKYIVSNRMYYNTYTFIIMKNAVLSENKEIIKEIITYYTKMGKNNRTWMQGSKYYSSIAMMYAINNDNLEIVKFIKENYTDIIILQHVTKYAICSPKVKNYLINFNNNIKNKYNSRAECIVYLSNNERYYLYNGNSSMILY